MHRPRSTPQIAPNRSKSQAKVIEICMDEEDSTQSTMIYPSKAENQKLSTNDTKPNTKSHPAMIFSDSSKNILPLHSPYSNKENISDETKISYQIHARVPLGQKIMDNNENLASNTVEYKPLVVSQDNNRPLTRKKQSHETSCTSELLNNLDMNIQEFKDLLANNIQKAKVSEKSNARAPIQPTHEDSRILEISQLSLKLEESKFCTENEPSELKLLKDFESKQSVPVNNSQFEKYFQTEVKVPDVTKEYEFVDTWRVTDPRVSSPYTNRSGDLANLSIHDSLKDLRSHRADSANYSVQEIPERSERRFEKNLARAKTFENGALESFQDDYLNIFGSFKKIMPEFESKSHILRYLMANESLGFEFLYSVMLDLKEIEKHVFLMHHKNSSREEFLKEQLYELTNSNQKFQREITDLHSRIEEKTVRSSRESSRPRMTTMHVRGRYQALLQALNEFYGNKLDILREGFVSAKNFSRTRITINDMSEDLVDEIENEEMHEIMQENLSKIKELHDLIGGMHKERTPQRSCKMENKETSTDFESIGALTSRRIEMFEDERSEYFEVREEQETQLNISEIEASKFEAVLREKDNEIDLIRKKEQMYQNVIYSLTKELRQLRGVKANKKELWSDKDIDLLFKKEE